MRVENLWIVRDPTPTSELADILFPIAVERLSNYVVALALNSGTNGSSAREIWSKTGHTAYCGPDAEGEALADAFERLRPFHSGFPVQPPEDLR